MLILAVLLVNTSLTERTMMNIQNQNPKAFLEQMMADYFVSPMESPRQAVDKYLTTDATHHADGKIVSREDFIGHLTYLQKNIRSMTFDYQQIVYDGEWLSVRHLGRTELNDGKVVESEVVVFFHFHEGKIDRSFEMTRPLSGIPQDRSIHTVQ